MRSPLPEPEGATKAWLRSLDLVGERAYIGPPKRRTYPFLVTFRVGGGPVLGAAPVLAPLMQIDVVGDPAKRGKDRYDMSQLATAVATEVESLNDAPFVFEGVRIDDGHVQSGPLWHPEALDNEEEQSRFMLTVEFVMRSVA